MFESCEGSCPHLSEIRVTKIAVRIRELLQATVAPVYRDMIERVVKLVG